MLIHCKWVVLDAQLRVVLTWIYQQQYILLWSERVPLISKFDDIINHVLRSCSTVRRLKQMKYIGALFIYCSFKIQWVVTAILPLYTWLEHTPQVGEAEVTGDARYIRKRLCKPICFLKTDRWIFQRDSIFKSVVIFCIKANESFLFKRQKKRLRIKSPAYQIVLDTILHFFYNSGVSSREGTVKTNAIVTRILK